jgi:co-chaperonin GroES (HSP10)
VFKPKFDYILVKPITQRLSSVIECVNKESFHRGMVCAVGPGDYPKFDKGPRRGERNTRAQFVFTEVKPGDFIAYVDLGAISNYYTKYREGDVDYLVMQEKDVVFVGEREEIDAGAEIGDDFMIALLRIHSHGEVNAA